MAYPVMLAIGGALSAAGTGMQIAAARESKREMNRSVSREIQRQRGYQDEASREFAASLARSGASTAESDIAQGEAMRQAAYDRIAQVPLGQPQSVTPPIESTTQGKVGAVKEQNLAGKQAAFMGLSEWQLRQMIRNLRAQQQLGQIGMFARDSAGVNPYEVQKASHAGDSLAGVGSLLGTAGSLAGYAGALGYGPTLGAVKPTMLFDAPSGFGGQFGSLV